jgi:hypothetical protein
MVHNAALWFIIQVHNAGSYRFIMQVYGSRCRFIQVHNAGLWFIMQLYGS